jgi:hypothetical protein
MITLNQFRDRFDQIRCGPADATICRTLIREICAYPWETTAERNAAQTLVNRLAALPHTAVARDADSQARRR